MTLLLSKSVRLSARRAVSLCPRSSLCRSKWSSLSCHQHRHFAAASAPSKPDPSTQFYAKSVLYQKPETDAQRDQRVKTLFGDIPPEELTEVTVDNKKVRVPKGVTVLQACEAAGVNIPRFCYHDRLSIAGNCRMCLVEVEKAKKPVASCANPIMPGMVIKTDTNLVKFAREGVVEFLLANHPLDCPICDQGGECDLQDISMTFGSLEGRYIHEDKRCVEDKDLGPFVKTVMNRCIHCTRCIRFADEIAGDDCLGTTGRGNVTEVGTYAERYFDSEVSGNVIDLCPVGALTNKAAAFKVRPWDLTIYESIDVMEATSASIVLDTRFNELIRIKPRLNEDINEEWISDKTRFCVDGVKRQRLDMPLVKNPANGMLEPSTWPDALQRINEELEKLDVENRSQSMLGLVGDLMDCESMVALKDFMNKLGCNKLECRMDGTRMDCDMRSNYLFNSTIPGIEYADVALLVGTNPRMEAPLINTRLRKAYLNGLDVYLIGNDAKLNYEKEVLGDSLSALQDIVNGTSPFCEILEEAQQPLIIFGMSTLMDSKCNATMDLVEQLIKKYPALKDTEWNGVSFLQTRAGRNAGLDIGFVDNATSSSDNLDNVEFVYCLGGDEYYKMNEIPSDAFFVYQGSHGDKGARRADVVLPGCSWVEKNGTFVNIDGRVQRSKAALTPPGQARNVWQVIRALAEICGIDIEYDNIEGIRQRMFDIAPHLENVDVIEANEFGLFDEENEEVKGMEASDRKAIVSSVYNEKFDKYFTNYFATAPISRSSLVLKKAAKELPNSCNS